MARGTLAAVEEDAYRRIQEVWGWDMSSLTKPRIEVLMTMMEGLRLDLETELLHKLNVEADRRNHRNRYS